MKAEIVKGCDNHYRVYGKMQYETVLGPGESDWFLKGVSEMMWVPVGSYYFLDDAEKHASLLRNESQTT